MIFVSFGSTLNFEDATISINGSKPQPAYRTTNGFPEIPRARGAVEHRSGQAMACGAVEAPAAMAATD
eukprot:11051473-Lingulodinium_polyedra.AAC.1